jgi:hypothetical protein
LFVFYFANGGYIIRISPIAKGIVVPLEKLMKSPLEGKKLPMAYCHGKEYPRVK